MSFFSPPRLWCAAAALAVTVAAHAQEPLPRNPDGTIQFRLVIDNSPLRLDQRPQQRITPAVEAFQRTGVNAYLAGSVEATQGKVLYNRWCAACHLPDGSGRIGPSVVDDATAYPRVATPVGLFEIVYGGGAGAMQPFGRRMDQDDVLKVMAYIDEMKARR